MVRSHFVSPILLLASIQTAAYAQSTVDPRSGWHRIETIDPLTDIRTPEHAATLHSIPTSGDAAELRIRCDDGLPRVFLVSNRPLTLLDHMWTWADQGIVLGKSLATSTDGGRASYPRREHVESFLRALAAAKDLRLQVHRPYDRSIVFRVPALGAVQAVSSVRSDCRKQKRTPSRR